MSKDLLQNVQGSALKTIEICINVRGSAPNTTEITTKFLEDLLRKSWNHYIWFDFDLVRFENSSDCRGANRGPSWAGPSRPKVERNTAIPQPEQQEKQSGGGGRGLNPGPFLPQGIA